jgi:cell division protein FtsB
MTPTEMDQITRPADPASLQPPPTYPSAPKTLRRPPSWVPAFQMGERRWWTVALAATLLVAALGIGLLYVDDSNNQNTIRTLTTQNESLTGRTQILQDQLKTTQTNLTATLGELAQTKAQLAHPHLVLWNVPQQLQGPSSFLAGGVPDTFTYHLEATSTGPMSVSILTLEQWATAIGCVDNGGGNTNWCMHHSGAVWSQLGVTSVNYDFHLAEGCADYLAVFTAASAVTITPNVSVTYNPASSATGACS